MKGNSMNKKVLFILPVLAMLLAGCNKAEEKASPVESEETTISESTSTSSQTSSQESSSEGTSSEQTSSEEISSEEQSSEQASSEEASSEETSSEEASSQEQSSEEQSSEESSSEESSSSEEQAQHVVAISVGGNSTNLTLNEDATLDAEHGQVAEFIGELANITKGQEVVFSLDGNPITEHIGTDQEDETNKNLVQGEVGHFVIHNDTASSNVTFKVYQNENYLGFCFWLTGYVADAPIEDSFKLFVKRGANIADYDMSQNTEKATEYYRQGLELEANDEVFFCITLDETAKWYHFSDVQEGCASLVNESAAYIHGEEEDPRSDGNLVIKEAGTYDFYVDTAKAKDTKQAIWISKFVEPNPQQLKTFYLKPNENWLKDNARFAVYAFGGTQGEQWFDMTEVTTGVYSVEIDVANFTKIIFCRMNPGTTENNWSNRWNQTSDLTITDLEENCYTVAEGAWSEGDGSWSTYVAE